MNTVNRAMTWIFDAVLTPFEMLGDIAALILVSGLFGIVALIVFKHISWQGAIKSTKNLIKGHMIAIRIYQDDLRVVASSVLKVVLRNFQYLGLNFGPILPLFVPFVLIAAQLVVRFGFAPIPVLPEGQDPGSLLAGSGVLFEVAMRPGEEARVAGLRVVLPPHGLTAISPLVRNTSDGRAFQELVATESGAWDLDLQVDGVSVGSKRLVAGAVGERVMQPERVSSFWASWLWPAEETFAADSPIESAAFAYPARDLGPLPGGPGGVILIFFLSSMLFGVLVLKPLKIQI